MKQLQCRIQRPGARLRCCSKMFTAAAVEHGNRPAQRLGPQEQVCKSCPHVAGVLGHCGEGGLNLRGIVNDVLWALRQVPPQPALAVQEGVPRPPASLARGDRAGHVERAYQFRRTIGRDPRQGRPLRGNRQKARRMDGIKPERRYPATGP